MHQSLFPISSSYTSFSSDPPSPPLDTEPVSIVDSPSSVASVSPSLYSTSFSVVDMCARIVQSIIDSVSLSHSSRTPCAVPERFDAPSGVAPSGLPLDISQRVSLPIVEEPLLPRLVETGSTACCTSQLPIIDSAASEPLLAPPLPSPLGHPLVLDTQECTPLSAYAGSLPLSLAAEPFFPPLPTHSFMHERLRAQLAWWEVIITPADADILDWISHGVPVHFSTEPPPFHIPSRPLTDPLDVQFMLTEVPRLVEIGAADLLTELDSSRFRHVSPSFVIPKKDSDKRRLICNFHHLSEFIHIDRHRFDNLSVVAQSLYKGAYMVTIDLQDFFFHLRLREDVRDKFVVDIGQGRYLRMKALPFGASLSPGSMHRLIMCVVKFLRVTYRMDLSAYLDDIIIRAPSPELAEHHRNIFLLWLHRLGIQRQPTKGVWQPAQRVTYLGMVIDTADTPTFHATEEAIGQTEDLAREVLRAFAGRRLTTRFFQQMVGKAMSLSLGVPQARHRCRSLYDTLAHPGNHRFINHLPDIARDDLTWWSQLHTQVTQRPARAPSLLSAIRITTDSSGQGWAMDITLPHAQLLSLPVPPQPVNGAWTDTVYEHLHITAKELLAVHMAVRTYRDFVRHRRLLLVCDNMAAVSVINSGSSRSPQMQMIVRELWAELAANDVIFSARYIPSELNPTDHASRTLPRHSWALSKQAFQLICQRWGTPTIDLFADRHNTHTPRFCSFGPDQLAVTTDAFAHNWALESLPYAAPPFPLITRVLAHMKELRAPRLVLITPEWKGRAWYRQLEAMTLDSFLLPLGAAVPLPLVSTEQRKLIIPEALMRSASTLRASLITAAYL